MPRRCCVRGCKSNYNGTGSYVTMFGFPKDPDLREKWLMAINRLDYTPTASGASGVCIKHFDANLIVREDILTRDDGSILVAVRKVPRLFKNAVPCLYHNPLNRNSEPEPKRRALDLTRPEVSRECVLPSDNIPSFSNFKECFLEKLDCNSWTVFNKPNYIMFMRVSTENGGRVIVSLKVKQDLSVEVSHEGVIMKHSKFRWLLGHHLLCDKWTKFESLLGVLGTYEEKIPPLSDKLNHHMNRLQEIIETEASANQEIYSKRCNFALQQLQLSLSLRKSYHPDMLAWARTLYSCNTSSYNLLRESDVLSLPHPDYLRKVIRDENTVSGVMLKSLLCAAKKPDL